MDEHKQVIDTTTDSAWEEWGRRDPYFGVLTHPKFRRSTLDESAKNEFFESGRVQCEHVLRAIRRHIDPDFAPKRILDFGCGVGRVMMPFATIAEEVVGLDVSPSMLLEARRNCAERGLSNVILLPSDDDLSALAGTFDLIHSCIVFQHIPTERGRAILATLLRCLRPGGVAAVQLTYSKIRFAATRGVAPAGPTPPRSAVARPSDADPEIQMNPYNLNEIFFLLQSYLVKQCHVEFTDHGGELGVFLFFSIDSGSTGVR